MNCKKDALILIETTVPPGTTVLASDIIKNHLIERGLSKDRIKIGHSYERVMPGPNYIDSIQNFYRVYSGIDEYSADNIESFLKTIISIEKYPLTRLKNTNATEMSKVLENSFRAMNIAFIVEWSRYAEESGVDLYEVVEAIRMRPTHKNIMLPGIGVGGYCLTKDPLLASWSKQKMFNSVEPLNMSENAVTINDKMPLYTYEYLKRCLQTESLKDKEVFLLGVSYAPDVGDTRYTPVELLCKLLLGSNCKIQLHDPFIAFWEELDLRVSQDFNSLSENTDIVIVSTGHSFYRENTLLLKKLMQLNQLLILDTIGLFNNQEINDLSTKHIVKVLGRGDL
jgi:UDP-N-acetyl-D-glucosamine dehydrogenase